MLLCRSPLLPGESLPSLLIRLAKLNRYLPTMLPRLCWADVPGYQVEHPTQLDLFQHLADLTQLAPVQLYQATRHVFAPILTPPGVEPERLTLTSGETGFLLPRRLVGTHVHRDTAAQFCPHCLQEAAYHRLIWLPIAVTTCLKHHCLLLNECPTCHQALSIRDLVDTRCHRCQTDPRQAPPSYLQTDPAGLLAQQIIQAWLVGSVSPEPLGLKLPIQPSQALYHLLDGLCSSIWPIEDNWAYQHQVSLTQSVFLDRIPAFRRMTPLTSYLASTTAFKAMTNWPTGFYEFLEAYRCRHGEPGPRDLSTDLGHLYRTWLQKWWQHPTFQFVQEIFDQYLLEHYPRSMTVIRSRRYWSNPTFARKFAFIPVSEAARLLDTIPGLVYWLIRSGELTAYEAQERNTSFPLLKRTEVLAVGQQKGVLLSVAQTAQQLGVSPRVIVDMTKLGLLAIEPVPEIEEGLVTKRSVTHYLSRLTDQVKDAVLKRPKAPLDLTTVTKTLSKLGLTEADIFKSILDGQLKSYCYQLFPQDLSKLVFAKASVTAYIRRTQTQRQKFLPDKQGNSGLGLVHYL